MKYSLLWLLCMSQTEKQKIRKKYLPIIKRDCHTSVSVSLYVKKYHQRDTIAGDVNRIQKSAYPISCNGRGALVAYGNFFSRKVDSVKKMKKTQKSLLGGGPVGLFILLPFSLFISFDSIARHGPQTIHCSRRPSLRARSAQVRHPVRLSHLCE